MKTYKQFLNENTHYLNIDIKKDFEFIIDIKNASQSKIDTIFKEFEKYTDLEDWLKKYLVSTDNGGKVWAWRINLTKGWGTKNLPYIQFNIITTPNWGINQNMSVIDNRITIEEFLHVGLSGVEDYIKTGNTYFKVLNELGCNVTNITPEEFLKIGTDNVKDFCLNDIDMKKNANKFNL